MSDFSDKELLHLNQIGLIPGPGETRDAFAERVHYTLHLADHLPKEVTQALSEQTPQEAVPPVLDLTLTQLQKQYDIAPNWIQIFFSNYKLPFWQGGCAWIFQIKEESPISSIIQLRKSFKHSSKYLGLYDRDELLTHELAHVGRMLFQEPKFEELLAYRTASSPYRRWFGPLIQSSAESALFLLLLFTLVVFDVFLLALGRPDAYSLALWLKTIPVVLIIAALGRLWKRQRTFETCLSKLKQCVKEGYAEAVAYRLTDDEILLFSKMSPQEIREYAVLQAKEELRWHIILSTYL